MKQNDEISPEILEMLAQLRTEPARDTENASRGEALFLAEARMIQIRIRTAPGKELPSQGWIQQLQSIFPPVPQHRLAVFSTMGMIFLIAALLFGGLGVTVAAAQASQPDQPLYAVKLLSEALREDLAPDAQSVYLLELSFLDRRAEEMERIFRSGGAPAAVVGAHYQDQVERVIRMAVRLPESQIHTALVQLQVHLQMQLQTFLQVQVGSVENSRSANLRVQQLLLVRLQWVEAGLRDPQQLRDLLLQGNANYLTSTPVELRPTSTCTASEAGVGKRLSRGTPTPGSGTPAQKLPGASQNSTQMAENVQAQNPWTTGTPSPGSGYGPGPGFLQTGTATSGVSGNGGPTQGQGQNNPNSGSGSDQQSSGAGTDPRPNAGGGNQGGKKP
jgi:hypothetical protein